MLDETNLTAALGELGYERVRRRVYEFGKFLPQVKHVLYFQSWGIGQFFVSAHFGFENRAAHDFGVAMGLKYGHPVFSEFRHKMRSSDTLLQFSIHRFASMSDRPWRNDKSDPMDVSRDIISFITKHHIPFVDSVANLDALLARLVADGEPCPWFAINGVVRSGAVAFLAKETGQSAIFTRNALLPMEKPIKRDLAPSLSPHEYVEALIKEAGLV